MEETDRMVRGVLKDGDLRFPDLELEIEALIRFLVTVSRPFKSLNQELEMLQKYVCLKTIFSQDGSSGLLLC